MGKIAAINEIITDIKDADGNIAYIDKNGVTYTVTVTARCKNCKRVEMQKMFGLRSLDCPDCKIQIYEKTSYVGELNG